MATNKNTGASKGTPPDGGHWGPKVAPLGIPWAVAVAVYVAALVAHRRWGGDPIKTPVAAVGFALAGVGLTGFAWFLAGKKNAFRRWLSATSAAAATVAATAILINGARPPVSDCVIWAAAVACLFWNVRHGMRYAHPDGDHAAAGTSPLELAIDAERVAIGRPVSTGTGVVTAPVRALPGHTLDAAIGPERVATALQVPPMITLTRDPDNAARGELQIPVANLLRDPIVWPGPSAAGQDITVPVPVGRYDMGQTGVLRPAGLPHNLEHLLVTGATGSGKSESVRMLVADMMTRRKVNVIGVDLKGAQTLAALAGGLAMPAIHDPKTVVRLLRQLPHVIRARTARLADEGLKMWTPASSLNFLVLHLEEAGDFAASSGQYDELLRKARSAGVWVITSLQRGTHTTISTDARANHGGGLCFGTNKSDDAGYVLPDSVMAAGVAPHQWGNRQPGMSYLTGCGAAPELWVRPLRWYYATEQQIERAVADGDPYRTGFDDVTRAALGDLLSPALPAPARVTVPTVTPTLEAAPEPPTDEGDSAEPDPIGDAEMADVTNQLMAEMAEWAAERGDDPATDGPVTADDLETLARGVVDPVKFTDDPVRVTPEQARQVLRDRLAEWQTAGRATFEVRELAGLWESVGRSRAWLYKQLDTLRDAGVVDEAPEYGVYALRTPVHAGV